jgi:hypothetical protein
MIIANTIYEFTPLASGAPVRVLGVQNYSPGQVQKVETWRLDLPAEYAGQFGDHVEFDSWDAMLSALASAFLDGDIDAVSERLVLKSPGSPPFPV